MPSNPNEDLERRLRKKRRGDEAERLLDTFADYLLERRQRIVDLATDLWNQGGLDGQRAMAFIAMLAEHGHIVAELTGRVRAGKQAAASPPPDEDRT